MYSSWNINEVPMIYQLLMMKLSKNFVRIFVFFWWREYLGIGLHKYSIWLSVSLIHFVLSLAFCRLVENNLMHLHILFRHEDSNIFHNREKRHRKLIHSDYWRCITYWELVQRYKRHSNSVKSRISSFPYQNLIFISEHLKLFCNVH